MTWRCYSTIFKAESPIHIGYRQIGILKTTRYYITGRAMWGAITANLTRALFSNPAPKDYQTVGNFVKENIRTTYFYPAIKKNEAGSGSWSEYEVDGYLYLVFLPEYTDRGIKFGGESKGIPKEEFEQTFVDSFVSTALETQTRTAEEGSLHEFEFIRNKVSIENKPYNVYWVGYLVVKENGEKEEYKIKNCEENDVTIVEPSGNEAHLSEVIHRVFVGGEKNYGLGRLILEPEGFKLKGLELFGKFKFGVDNEKPVITGDTAPAHVKLGENELKEGFLGEIEPVVGLEWSEKGAGQSVSSAVVCITPGSRFVEQNYHRTTRKIEYILHEYGLLIIK